MTHLCQLMQNCFREAEQALGDIIKEKYHALNEEMITHLFWCELKVAVAKHNENGERSWSHALQRDLAEYFHEPRLEFNHQLHERLGGLFCDVQLHNHYREGRTGGDFGIFTAFPVLDSNNVPVGECLIPIQDRALLVQAKLGSNGEPFGELTKSQEAHLLKNKDFLALALYSYNDKKKTEMNRFAWLSCKSAQQGDLARWLKKKIPEETLDSDKLIHGLHNGQLGTADEQIIKDWITNHKDERPWFKLTINWPKRPKSDGMLIKLSEFIPVTETIQNTVSQV